MKKRYESIEKPDKCPKCGAPVYPILYGLPVMSEEEYFNTYHEHVIYGGCCISEDDPEWACSKCGAEIYNAKHIPYTKKDAYAKRPKCQDESRIVKYIRADIYTRHPVFLCCISIGRIIGIIIDAKLIPLMDKLIRSVIVIPR